jgi:outer membrane protein OmpA-like peptidoglycan-associated protein
MRLKTAALLASAWLASCGVALADVDSGNEVTVNPVPMGGGGMLLYPGGQYMRIVPPLLQPGQNPRDVIHLHMPGQHVAHAATAPVLAEAPPRRRQPKVVALPSPPPPAAAPSFNIPAPPSIASRPPVQTARAEPPPAAARPDEDAIPSNLTKRSVILFAADASDPAKSALGAIKFLAGDLSASMTGASSRIQLLAYGGAHGDKSSDARRLSLKRALSIRQVLIDDGVSPDRIDVRAMGGTDDSGPTDRVDVYIKA